jgi:hypothetical protein
MYVGGASYEGDNFGATVRRVEDTLEGSVITTTVDTFGVGGLFSVVSDIAVGTDGAVYVAGADASVSTYVWIVRRSPTGLSGTFQTVDGLSSTVFSGGAQAYTVAISPVDGSVYVGGRSGSYWSIRRSPTGLSGTFVNVDISGSASAGANINSFCKSIRIGADGKVFAGGSVRKSWIIRSSSLGASGTFAPVDAVTFSRNSKFDSSFSA